MKNRSLEEIVSKQELARVAARHWAVYLKTPPDEAELLTLGQTLTFTEALEAYLLHVFGESRLHVAGICDEPSFYTKRHLCEEDRERLYRAATSGMWIRVGPQESAPLNCVSALISINPREYFPHGATMCIRDGKAEARTHHSEPFRQIYPKT